MTHNYILRADLHEHSCAGWRDWRPGERSGVHAGPSGWSQFRRVRLSRRPAGPTAGAGTAIAAAPGAAAVLG